MNPKHYLYFIVECQFLPKGTLSTPTRTISLLVGVERPDFEAILREKGKDPAQMTDAEISNEASRFADYAAADFAGTRYELGALEILKTSTDVAHISAAFHDANEIIHSRKAAVIWEIGKTG